MEFEERCGGCLLGGQSCAAKVSVLLKFRQMFRTDVRKCIGFFSFFFFFFYNFQAVTAIVIIVLFELVIISRNVDSSITHSIYFMSDSSIREGKGS